MVYTADSEILFVLFQDTQFVDGPVDDGRASVPAVSRRSGLLGQDQPRWSLWRHTRKTLRTALKRTC